MSFILKFVKFFVGVTVFHAIPRPAARRRARFRYPPPCPRNLGHESVSSGTNNKIVTAYDSIPGMTIPNCNRVVGVEVEQQRASAAGALGGAAAPRRRRAALARSGSIAGTGGG